MKKIFLRFPAVGEIIRYGIVGIVNNLLGYIIYLFVAYWLGPKIALTILYPVGATTAYFGHSKYSFSNHEKKKYILWRYIAAHLISYGVNYLMLQILWGKFNFPYQAVQAAAIFVCAGVLFVLFKYFVFRKTNLKNV